MADSPTDIDLGIVAQGPQGKQGEKGADGVVWLPYPDSTDGHWHLRKISGQLVNITPDQLNGLKQYLQDYIDNEIENGKW